MEWLCIRGGKIFKKTLSIRLKTDWHPRRSPPPGAPPARVFAGRPYVKVVNSGEVHEL